MADDNNIKADNEYIPSEATRSSWFSVDRDYLTSLGYPLSGKGKHAQLTYQINAAPSGGSSGPLDVNVVSTGSGLPFLTNECTAVAASAVSLDVLMTTAGTVFGGDTTATGVTIQLSPTQFGVRTIDIGSAGASGITLSNEAGFQPNMLSFKISDVSEVYITGNAADVLFKVLVER